MIPPQILAGGAAVVMVAGFLGGWAARDWKADSAALDAVEAQNELRDGMQATIDGNAREYEQWRADRERERPERLNTIREIFRNAPPIPAECAAPDAFAGLLERQTLRANAATLGQSSAGVPDPARATAPADRP